MAKQTSYLTGGRLVTGVLVLNGDPGYQALIKRFHHSPGQGSKYVYLHEAVVAFPPASSSFPPSPTDIAIPVDQIQAIILPPPAGKIPQVTGGPPEE